MSRWILTCLLICASLPGFAADTDYTTLPKAEQPKREASTPPPVAENGDRRGADNDGDGRAEPVHVKGYFKKDGTYVREHYRAKPAK